MIPSAAVFAAAIEDAEGFRDHAPCRSRRPSCSTAPAAQPLRRRPHEDHRRRHVLTPPVDQVWDALLDPPVLVRTIPGCERLEATGDNAYAMTVTAGVAAIKGTYAGLVRALRPRSRTSRW